ncbi:conserved hypothetical protein [Candidatus Zixiibacteriota bacterium]|nr:conserved hypothetical protein [candidate division Zixibacteria bacterium]
MSGNGSLVKTIEIKDRQGRVIATEDVVTYAGLLSLAHDQGLKRIETALVQLPEEANGHTAVFLAIVETESGIYKGHGDASPDNVASRIIPHIIRMAETRAKARALRDAVNIGVVSIEELALEGNGRPVNGNSTEPQPNHGSNRIPGVRSRSRPQNESDQPSNSDSPMTDAQRRYLFRLLAERQIEGDDAHRHLLEKASVESLDQITKGKASILIDEMVNAVKPAEEVPF